MRGFYAGNEYWEDYRLRKEDTLYYKMGRFETELIKLVGIIFK